MSARKEVKSVAWSVGFLLLSLFFDKLIHFTVGSSNVRNQKSYPPLLASSFRAASEKLEAQKTKSIRKIVKLNFEFFIVFLLRKLNSSFKS